MENCSLTVKTAPEFIPNPRACTPRSRFNKRKQQGQKPHSLCDTNRGSGDNFSNNLKKPVLLEPLIVDDVESAADNFSAASSREKRRSKDKISPENKKKPQFVKRGPAPPKKDMWWIDRVAQYEKQMYDKKFNGRRVLEDCYAKKLAKLQKQRERELIGHTFKVWKNKASVKMQSGIEGAILSVADKIENPLVASVAEDMLLLTYDLVRSRSVLDYVVAAVSFMKRRTSEAVLQKVRRKILSTFIQGFISSTDVLSMQAGVESKFDKAHNVLKLWPRVKTSPLWRKINTVVVFATSLTLFEGDKISKGKAIRIEEEFYRSRALAQADFVYNVLDLLLFVADRGIQVVRSKTIDPMFHSGGSYETWYLEAAEIIGKSKFLSNPEAHNIDVHSFTNTLDDLIRKGESMYKYACELDKGAKGVIRSTTAQLQLVRATHLNRKTAQKTRKAPLALCVEGHSSIAKTTFANILHYYYGVTRDKNVELGSRYTRMATSEFWDGFSTDQWSILLDDIAFIKPGACNDIDPTLKELIQIINNAPLTANMASLEEKGAAPVMPELVVATTNTPDLNLSTYFTVPLAVARRLPFHIRLRPKPELLKNDWAINEKALTAIEPGFYPDWWDIQILTPEPVPISEDPAQEWLMTSKLQVLHEKLDMPSFLKWYASVIRDHNTVQLRVAASEHQMRTTRICEVCDLPSGMCSCLEPQHTDGIMELSDIPILFGEDGTQLDMQVGRENDPDAFLNDPEFPLERAFLGVMVWFRLLIVIWNYFCFSFTSLMLSVVLLGCQKWYTGKLKETVLDPVMRLAYVKMRYIILVTLHNNWETIKESWKPKPREMIIATWRKTKEGAASLKRCGDLVVEFYFSTSYLVKLIVVILTVALAAFGVYISLNREKPEMQGGLLSTIGERPAPGDDPDSIWKREAYTPSALDIGRHTISWKELPRERIEEILFRNCAFVRFYDGVSWKVAKCIGLGGQYFLTTNHSLPVMEGRIKCQLVRSRVQSGPTGNVNFTLGKCDIKQDFAKDLLIFRCQAVPPMRNITELFIRKELRNFRANGFYLGRNTDGAMFSRPVVGIFEATHYNSVLQKQTQVFWGKAEAKTESGDCGAILVAKSGSGPIIIGIHQLGGTNCKVGAIKTTYEDILHLLDGALLVSDAPPMLDAPSTNVGVPGVLHRKSPINYVQGGVAECYGSFEGFRATPKFRTQSSMLAPYLINKGYKDTHCRPNAKGWEPKYKLLSELVVVHDDVCTDTVEKAVEALTGDFCNINPKWKDEVMIVDMHTAINGVPGLKYVDSIKRSTSAGFPYSKPKKALLNSLEPTEDYPDAVEVTPEVVERVELMLERYNQDQRASPVFKMALKDEALPREKVAKGKVRGFMISTIELTIVMRMLTLCFVRIAQSNHFQFECAPGMEAQSCEWDWLYQYLTQFGKKRLIFGDFQGYDKSMHPVFLLGAFETMARFIERSGGTARHARLLRCMSYDIAFAFLEFFGDLIMLCGKNPSGQALTAIINGIVNSLYMRFVWIHCSPLDNVHEFKLYVALITYGDDNGMGVSLRAPFFTHTAIRDVLAKIGVVYTMADKSSESLAYIDIEEGSFLKRSWRWCEDTNTMIAPLEVGSIHKMLMTWTPSDVVSPEVQAADMLRSANSEWFWHGRTIFEEQHALLNEVAREFQLEPFLGEGLETWYHLMARYKDNSKQFLLNYQKVHGILPDFVDISDYRVIDDVSHQSGHQHRCPCGDRDCHQSFDDDEWRPCLHCGKPRYDDYDMECSHCLMNDTCERCMSISAEVAQHIAIVRTSGYPPWLCRDCVYLELTRIAYRSGHRGRSGTTSPNQITSDTVNPPSHSPWDEEVHASVRIVEAPVLLPTIGTSSERIQATPGSPQVRNSGLNRPTNTNTSVHFQSGVETNAEPTTGVSVQAPTHANTEQKGTVTFLDSDMGDTLTFAEAQPSLFEYDAQMNASLGEFLSRPRLILSSTWTPGGYTPATLDPWSAFLSTPEIEYKLNNFAFIRGNLKVKVVVNAAPFYYGALMMYYTPLPSFVPLMTSTTNSGIQPSQRPHIWILPQSNTGGEMTLPFFYSKNYVAVTSAAEVALLGRLSFRGYTPLASANGASSNGVQIQVYAWMENPCLFGPTTSLSMQSGDEYGNGPISAPAAAAAHWAMYLSKVPIIGRFAKATSIGASAVSQMAKLFGWTNVPVIEDVKPLKNVPFHDLASAHISEPTSKFFLDPKGELCVDPAVVGLSSEDELSIAHLVQRESFLTTGTWAAGAAAGSIIFSAAPNPYLGDRGTISSAGTYTCALTPMAWTAAAFGHWRGDIIFRFKVICSKFHSGRLRIHWDPMGDLSSTADVTHVTYTTILDIQDNDEVEFRVPYMQALPWTPVQAIVSNLNAWTTSGVISANGFSNGSLTVRVLNNLTAPTDAATCSVLVFVRGAENLEFANPRDISSSAQLLSMQSGEEPFSPNTPLNERYLINWGEPVPSVRLLLRRSNLVDRITVPKAAITATDEAGILRVTQSRLPPPPGYDPGAYTKAKGVETPATTYGYNFTNQSSLSWFAGAFIAMRGSVRWHYNVVNPDGSLPHNITITRRVGSTLTTGSQNLECVYISGAPNTATTQSLLKGKMWGAYDKFSGASGVAMTNPNTQTGVSVEYPMMTNYLFQYANPAYWLLGTNSDGSSTDTYNLDMDIHPAAGTGYGRLQIHRYASAGTDFTLHFFLNTPTVSVNGNAGLVPV